MTRCRWVSIAALVLCWLAVCSFCLAREHSITGSLAGVALDDSWIHYRYAQNLVRGYGLSFNPGELSAGSTSPLWVVVLAFVGLFTGEFLVTSKMIGAICFLGAALVSYRMALKSGLSDLAALFAGAGTLLSGRFVWSALSGMETSAFAFLSVLAISMCPLKVGRFGAALRAGVLFGVATLLRPEGWLLFAVVGMLQLGYWMAARHRDGRNQGLRLLMVELLAFSLIASVYVVFCLVSTGKPLPNTFYAKTQLAGRVSMLPYVLWVVSVLLIDSPAMLVLFLVGAVSYAGKIIRVWPAVQDDGSVIGFAWLSILPAAYSVVAPYTTIYFVRYLIPLAPLYALAVAFGIDWIQSILKHRLRAPVVHVALGMALAVVVLSSLPGLGYWTTFFGKSVDSIQKTHVAAGRWLAERSEQGDQIATHDVGAIAFLSDRYIIDLAGLVSPSIQPLLEGRSAGTWDDAVFEYLQSAKPRYVVVLDEWFPTWKDRPQLKPVYTQHLEESAITAGSDLTIYEWDW